MAGISIKMGKSNKINNVPKWTKGAANLVKKEFYANTPLTREEINAERKVVDTFKYIELSDEGHLNELMVWLTDQMAAYGPHCSYSISGGDYDEPLEMCIAVQEPEPESVARYRILSRKFTAFKKTAAYADSLKAAEETIVNSISKKQQKEQAKRLKEMQLYVQKLDADRQKAEAEIAKLVARASSE